MGLLRKVERRDPRRWASIISQPGCSVVYEYDQDTDECLQIVAATDPNELTNEMARFVARLTRRITPI